MCKDAAHEPPALACSLPWPTRNRRNGMRW